MCEVPATTCSGLIGLITQLFAHAAIEGFLLEPVGEMLELIDFFCKLELVRQRRKPQIFGNFSEVLGRSLMVAFVGEFEEAVAHAARERGVDGVVCGHIHCAEIRQIGDITYYNDGDWVESCTALVEDHAGAMSLIDWAEEQRLSAADPTPGVPAQSPSTAKEPA